ncbi:DUF4435 domain-containing protein [Elizabethkingia anophelis]|nr:DUF4435 domain-containing protein [Elizabethkingia anophelis]
MDSLEYSNDALEVISHFYNCDDTIYVEGKDDVIFWKNIFSISNKKVHIEDVGGIEELKKYIDKIINENVEIYVAKDNDYCDFFDTTAVNERIYTTYGHSIENTLYNINTIKSIIKNFSRIQDDNLPVDVEKEINDIILNFETSIKQILIYEITNEIYQKGISVLGANTCKFLKNNQSIELCENKITNFIEEIKNNFQESELNSISEKLEQNDKPLWFIVRGHFLTNFVINIIKKMVNKLSDRRINLPIEVIYPLFIDKNNIESSEDIQYYKYA